jgi:hypothetical protein
MEIRQLIKDNKTNALSEDSQGTLWLGKRIWIPNLKHLKELILWEAHDSAYSIQRDIAEYVSLCDICQKVKAGYQRPTRLLQPLKIPEWKLEEIGMDFIVWLPRTQAGYDSIWVIVDRLTKLPISSQLRWPIWVLSLRSFTCQESCVYMVYRRWSC